LEFPAGGGHCKNPVIEMDQAPIDNVRIQRGAMVILVLHSPREKCWGLLDEISPAGVFLRGLDLNAFDSWVHAVVHDEPFIGLGDLFFPMWRVERISKDEAAGEMPSLSQQVERRTGRTIAELVGR
jgi:hypothetical protein